MYQRHMLVVNRLVAVAPINKQRGYFIGHRRGIHFKSSRNPSVNSSTSSVAFGPTEARNPILTFSLRVGRQGKISRLVGREGKRSYRTGSGSDRIEHAT